MQWIVRVTMLLALSVLSACSVAVAQDDFEARRGEMVDGLVEDGIITDQRVIDAMRAVPRHSFVPQGQAGSAYNDNALPIGEGQTISAPSIVGLMTEALQPQPTDRVLEIGTGSGYQAAVLSKLVRHVYTIEILEPLAVSARNRLQTLGYSNVTVRHGDGYLGWPENAPFDKIIVTCAPEEVPQALVDQLKDGGLMVIPVGEAGWAQKLYLMEKKGDRLERTELADVIFVPMVRSDAQ
ncbi:MAG: protein-L-isoaspartate(D-aspartate) O-methyltransferase [candidate division WS1 bacterium]|nr:protein-L-isoaspartate(D-aspartate) O-methyltransferase [candidate division WS1 bacterium]